MKKLYILMLSLLLFIGCTNNNESIYKNLKNKEEQRNKNFIVDSRIVIDTVYNTAYTVVKEPKTYNQAKDYCFNLDLNNLNTWRVASYPELGNILNITNLGPKIYRPFLHSIDMSNSYWTTRNSSLKKDLKIGISFYDGKTKTIDINEIHNVICVTTIKFSKKLSVKKTSKEVRLSISKK